MLRRQSIFSLTEVKYAILETDGSLSVMRKPEYEPPTARDMGIEAKPDTFTVTVIDKGKSPRNRCWANPLNRARSNRKLGNKALTPWKTSHTRNTEMTGSFMFIPSVRFRAEPVPSDEKRKKPDKSGFFPLAPNYRPNSTMYCLHTVTYPRD